MNKRHDELVALQFGSQANAYVTSAVHATGPDLQELERLAASSRFEDAIDIGCGGGHVTYAVAPHVARVTAFDVSEEMLTTVARTARERGFDNVLCGKETWSEFRAATTRLILRQVDSVRTTGKTNGVSQKRSGFSGVDVAQLSSM